VTPVVDGWVAGSEAKKGPGSDLFFDICFVVLLNSPHRETPQNREIGFGFFVDSFVKRFFCSVFELPSLRNTRGRDKTKSRGKTDIEIFVDFFGKRFRHGLFAFCKHILMVI
jgi:hypothetical protein